MKMFSRIFRRINVAAILMGSALFATAALQVVPASAQAINTQQVAQCLFDKSTPEDKDTMRKLVVAALTDDLGSIKGLLFMFISSVSRVATNDCGVTVEQLGQPDMQQALSQYGSLLGQKIMMDAMAKIK